MYVWTEIGEFVKHSLYIASDRKIAAEQCIHDDTVDDWDSDQATEESDQIGVDQRRIHSGLQTDAQLVPFAGRDTESVLLVLGRHFLRSLHDQSNCQLLHLCLAFRGHKGRIESIALLQTQNFN